jgi:post-segregation antitoxin (ccd killing protein)
MPHTSIYLSEELMERVQEHFKGNISYAFQVAIEAELEKIEKRPSTKKDRKQDIAMSLRLLADRVANL